MSFVPRVSASGRYPTERSCRGANWNHEETQILVDAWEEQERDLSDQYAFGVGNKMVYAKTAKRLRECGYERTYPQIQFKMKQLKTKYKGVMGRTSLGGRPGAHWEFFEQIDQILRRASSRDAQAAVHAPYVQTPRGHVDDTSEASGASQATVIDGKRQSGKIKPAAAAASAPSTSSSTATSSTPPPTSSTAPQPAGTAVPSLPEVPESDYEEDEDDDDDEEGGLEETEGEDIQDLFGQSQTQDVEIDFSAEMSENNINKTTEPVYTSFNPTAATNSSKAHKRPASSPQQNPKRPRGRPKANAPPRDDLTIAQAITDAMMRFIDHQSFHLTEQTKLLQRYLKFERARMRWEMDMETRRMKWEEEREMREEERRERQEELQAKRVSDNREFMLQMAVVLGNGAAGASKDSASTKN